MPLEQIELARENGQKVLIIGDFNGEIGDWISGNKLEVTKSGKLLQKLITKNKLAVVNSMEVCSGRWTRKEGKPQSIIDYVLIGKEDESTIQYMDIDEESERAPIGYRDGKMMRSDHNVITVKMDWTMEMRDRPKRERTVLIKQGDLAI